MSSATGRATGGAHFLLGIFLLGAFVVHAAGLPSQDDGTTLIPVHRLPIVDELGEKIVPAYTQSLPFSTRKTCGTCHDYEKISRGWHFNAAAGIVPAGRAGEPWIWLDPDTGMQLPLSSRKWEGTRTPESVGLSDWMFVKQFARHMPGGGKGDPHKPDLDPNARWQVSGKLEINCLGCHSTSSLQDHSEWVRQIERENLRWAATAASGLADVGGMASRVKDTWDIFDGPNRDDPEYAVPPYVKYDSTQFDRKNRTVFNIDSKPQDRRCMQCHAVAHPDTEALHAAGDIHSVSGMSCVDCHRNGLDHNMTRGYDGEMALKDNPVTLDSSCRTCHMGSEHLSGSAALGGTHGAPKPAHKGMPPVHLEKLSCTVCHSGPWPEETPARVRTARANRLGIFGRASWYTDAPHIVEPVFVRNEAGVIEPRRMMWPAYWGRITDNDIEPLAPADVQAAGVGILDAEAQVVAILRALGAAESEEGVPALSMNGKAYIVVADDHLDVQEGVGATTDPAVWTRSSSNGLAALVPPFEVEGFDPNENGDHWDISERIGGVLALLANKAPAGAAPVFVNGGKIFAKDADGFVTVTGEETTAALTWGWLADGSVSPLVPAFTLRVAAATTGRAEILTEEQVAMVLDRLAEKQAGRVAFIASGKMFTRRDDGTLDSREHPAAEPVSWPLGHDVRPASQSLGVSACTDCHRRDAPFFFAPVTPHGPLVTQAASATPMHAFMDLDGPFQEMFGLSFQMRPLLKIVLLLMSGLMALVLLFLALKLIERAMKYAQEKRRV